MIKRKFQKTLFIFRRDLRLYDNSGLIDALKNSEQVIPCFIFTPDQIEHNRYRSDFALQFLIESVEDLQGELEEKGGKLYLFYDDPEKVVEQCIEKLGVDRVVVNRDYTPYSLKRDERLERVCKKFQVEWSSFDDALLHPPEQTLKADGHPYTIFTPYFRNGSKLTVAAPQPCRLNHFFKGPISFAKGNFKTILPRRSDAIAVHGGRREGLKILKKLDRFKKYDHDRDFPEHPTTFLSAYLKFTVLSPREVYDAIVNSLGIHHPLIRSLYWRDFFTGIAFFFPHVFEGAFQAKFKRVQWSDDKKAFQAWCDGKTGFPIVDAGMRQLNTTGYMHNRVRMIVASFLTKDLHIDWRWGERYFATHLVDYDPAVNNGNWQWAASTGCDAQPYFRIFNPWTQQKKFDPDCVYIKRWVDEFKDLSPQEIHHKSGMVDHATEAKVAIKKYLTASS